MNTAKNLPSCEIANVIEIRRKRPMVSSLKIAELFERPHNAVLKAIRNELTDEISLGEIDQSDYLDSRGKRQPTYWLDERQALVVMPFLGGVNARIGQRKLVDAYLYFRDHFCDPPRKDLLALKRSAHLPLMDAIQEFRELQGKLTDKRHYQCENKLCNWVVTGKFAAIDEKTLSNADLEMLAKVRERNAAFILSGLDYDIRKPKLAAFGIRLRTKMLAVAA